MPVILLVKAACRDADPELFFAPEGERAADRVNREYEATRICRGCPVRNICLEWASDAQVVGFWAETNEIERGMLRARQVAA